MTAKKKTTSGPSKKSSPKFKSTATTTPEAPEPKRVPRPELSKKWAVATKVAAERAKAAPKAVAEKPEPKVERLLKSTPTDIMMQADKFNVIHCRVALGDGLTPTPDRVFSREKIFQVVAHLGWEETARVVASCARLFAEVKTPQPEISRVNKDNLHAFAVSLDAGAMALRSVDWEATLRPNGPTHHKG